MSKNIFKLANDLEGRRGQSLNGRTFRIARDAGCVLFVDASTNKILMKTAPINGIYSGKDEAAIMTKNGSVYQLVVA